MTMQCRPDTMNYNLDPVNGASSVTERMNLTGEANDAQPAVVLMARFPTGDQLWTQVPHLLDSPPFEQHFVVDIDNNGRGELRFGDGQYGREVAGATEFIATYRIGNGRAGNIGAEALAHIVQSEVASCSMITAIRNPLASTDGTDMETIEEVRQKALAAFHAEQFRAVTEGDYKDAALKMEDVAGAVAAFRWTGSWYTVVLAIDPLRPEDLITESGGRTRLEPAFRDRVKAHITRYRLAGYDLEIRSGEYVPIEIDLLVCVEPDHFKGDVLQAVSEALSSHINPDGSKGFFHPDFFTFGQPVYLSRIYAAVEVVEGVDSAVVTRFRVFDQEDNDELDTGIIPMDAWQIARLDNDPNFQENGVLRLSAGAGK
ncbi:MAG: putative baseplate assembly protein [Proteobacteria bacterium]|nr:putative baseplate assembly protein [Pseudomonadota bacterium]